VRGDDAPNGFTTGGARVFVRSGTTWTEEATLFGSSQAAAAFGWSVSLSADGGRALIGGPNDAPIEAGTARVFVRSGSTWTEEGTLQASNRGEYDHLGWSVSLSANGHRALLGAHRDDTAAGVNAGSAHVFTLLPFPVVPTLVSPSGTITTSTPTYVWKPLATTTSYLLYVNDSTGTRINQAYTPPQLGCADELTNCSVMPSAALSPGAGRFWVQAQTFAGAGAWGTGLAFTVSAQPAPATAPSLIAPTGTIATATPTYTWSRVPAATEYYLWVSDSKGTRVQQVVGATLASCAASGDCSFRPSTALYEGNTKFWVRAQNSSGHGPWSVAKSFGVDTPDLPGLVSLTLPAVTSATNNPTYTWQSQPVSTQYHLWVSDAVTTRVNVILDSSTVCSGSTCTYFPNEILSPGNGRWWVQGKNTHGNGPWGSGTVFSVP
jgi:hypothetical protein